MNRDITDVTDGLLARWLAGEANPAEDEAIARWQAAGPANKKQAEDFRAVWLHTKGVDNIQLPDETQAWQRFQSRVSTEAPPAKRISFTPKAQAWRMAAILLMLLGAGTLGWYFLAARPGQILALEAGNTVRTDTLPDGSVITLNKGATLRHPRTFRGDTRNVTLAGEAFFSVAPDKSRPFIINANGVDVTVVGTTFNVKTSAATTEVIVETGVVQVARSQESVTLHPHEQVIMTAGAAAKKKSTTDLLYNYYRTHEFVCNATPLGRLVAILNDAYSADIKIDNARLAALPITTTFRNESLEKILYVISETLSVRVEKSGGQFIIR